MMFTLFLQFYFAYLYINVMAEGLSFKFVNGTAFLVDVFFDNILDCLIIDMPLNNL